MTPRNTILVGDAVEQLQALPGGEVDCCMTSPPYYQLRDYNADGQIGLEATVDDWVRAMRPVMKEIGRVLKPTGSAWINLGDSFSRHVKYGAPPKSLLAAPERFLIAMIDDGWIVRGKVIWAKANPMPHSVEDRLTTSYDVVYHLVRSRRYYFDLNAIRVPHRSRDIRTKSRPEPSRPANWKGALAGDSNNGLLRARPDGVPGHPLGGNPGDVWRYPVSNFRGAHFATFPPALVERPLLATCPEAVCTACGQPWRRAFTSRREHVSQRRGNTTGPGRDRHVRRHHESWRTIRTVGDLVPCGCEAPTIPGLILDPFFGAGTVGVVAERFGRDWLGTELNPAYAEMATERIEADRAKRAAVVP